MQQEYNLLFFSGLIFTGIGNGIKWGRVGGREADEQRGQCGIQRSLSCFLIPLPSCTRDSGHVLWSGHWRLHDCINEYSILKLPSKKYTRCILNPPFLFRLSVVHLSPFVTCLFPSVCCANLSSLPGFGRFFVLLFTPPGHCYSLSRLPSHWRISPSQRLRAITHRHRITIRAPELVTGPPLLALHTGPMSQAFRYLPILPELYYCLSCLPTISPIETHCILLHATRPLTVLVVFIELSHPSVWIDISSSYHLPYFAFLIYVYRSLSSQTINHDGSFYRLAVNCDPD